MPAVPALIMAGGAIASHVAANKARKSAMKQAMERSPEEQGYMDSQTKLADQFKGQGGQLYQAGMPQIRSVIDYYRTLLDGSRAARMNAMSGEAQDTAEAYAGADAAADRRLTGGEREQAKAENARARAGQIGRLVTGVRPGAAAALGTLGQGLVGQAGQFQGAAGDITGSLLSNSTQNRQGAFAVGDAAAQRTANTIGSITGAVSTAWGQHAGTPRTFSDITGNAPSPRITYGGRLPGAPLPAEVSY